MRAGNAILIVFFIWLAIELPIKILTVSDTYNISGFLGLNLGDWVILSIMLPFFLAIISGICGKEKKAEEPLPQQTIIERVREIPIEKEDTKSDLHVAEAVPVEETSKPVKNINDIENNIDNIYKTRSPGIVE